MFGILLGERLERRTRFQLPVNGLRLIPGCDDDDGQTDTERREIVGFENHEIGCDRTRLPSEGNVGEGHQAGK